MMSGIGVDPAFHEETGYDALHANYWLSGLAGHRLKHELDLPLVSTFHTLARVKAEASPEEVSSDEPHRRAEAEATIMRCSEVVLASCSVEAAQLAELYDCDPARIRVVAPGVDHAFFGPGDRPQARRALGLPADRAPPAVRGSDPAVEGCRRGRAGPGGDADQSRRPSRDRRRAERPAGRGPSRRRSRSSSTTWGWPTVCASWIRNRTSCSRPTTAPPTSASCPAVPSPSVSWPSKLPRAGRRWWPPPWGV